MSFLDIILGLLLAYGLYKGLKNGLFVELASLVALIAGIFGAIHFSYIAGDYLFFGTLKVAVILGALLVFFERLNSSVGIIKGETMENSILYEPVKEIGAFVFSAVLPEGKNLQDKP